MCFCTWASPCGSTSASLTSSVSLTEARGLITISSLHSVSDVLGDSARSRNSSRRPLNRILSKRFNMVGTTESSVYLNMTSPPAAKTRTKKNQFANAAPLICGFFTGPQWQKRELSMKVKLPVNLHPHPHLWSQLGNKLPSQDVWAPR